MPTSSKLNILVVDDEPANLIALEAVLAPLNENLVFAGSGEEALAQMLKAEFAVVLLDIRMPTMDGFEVARFIRNRPRSSRTPIIFLTAEEAEAFPVEEAYALGAVDYLTKPFIPVVLRSKVAVFADLHRKNEEITLIERRRHAAALNAKDERIRLILDNIKDYAFVGTDDRGNVTEWEGGAEAITGWRKDEAIGQPMSRFFSPDDMAADSEVSELSEMSLARESGRAEYRRWQRRMDGARFYAEGVLVALVDTAGALQGYANIFRDATLAQEIAADLQASEERFSRLLESSGDGIYGIDPDGNCIFLNAAGAAMLGFDAAELVGQPIHDIVHHHQADGADYLISECKINRAANAGIAARIDDEVFWRKDGTPVPVAYSVSPMIVAGKNAGAVITFTDITERKRAEEELRQLAADLSLADQRKTEFLATLGHELRNPLAPIRNSLQVLRLASNNQTTIARMRSIMERQVDHMVNLVDELLDVARISSGNIELKKERVELKTILATALEISLPLIEANGHAHTLNVTDEALIIDADPTRIAQVVSNILNNAAKYTPDGGSITLTVERDAGEVVITVTDSGMGIPAEALSTVFEMFAQVRRNISRANGGLGIGLSLVRRLVMLHGGTVTAYSAGPGTGSSFTVRLPLVDTESADSSDTNTDIASTTVVAAKSFRVMIIDDNADAAQTLVALLDMLGHSTRLIDDANKAVEACRDFQPDVVFVDIGMPGMTGYEVAREVKNIGSLPGVILVALTGRGTEKDRARSFAAGFDYHLTKPVEFAEIDRIMAGLLADAADHECQREL